MEITEEKEFRVLVVDDNPKNIQVLGNILREAKYIVGYATDGKQALTVLQKSDGYDLVLLDIDMPVVDGYDTCKAIRADEGLKEIPVIFLTAFSEAESIVKGFEVGAQDYITKPFYSKELLARVHTQLQLKYKTDLVKKMNRELESKVEERTNELTQAYEQLNNINNMKTDFLYYISQEIRKPLNGIFGAINLIKSQEYSSTIQGLVETLDLSVSGLEDFTSKTTYFSQITRNNYAVQATPVNVRELVQYIILELDYHLNIKNITINADGVKDASLLHADRDMVFKAFSYILQNAIAYSPKGGKIIIGVTEDEHTSVYSFTDQGQGFSDEALNILAESFRFTPDLNSSKIGLSLYIIKQIMRLHKGEMTIFNRENTGACVQLTFKK